MKDLLNKAKTKAVQVAQDLRPEPADVKRTTDAAVDTATKVVTEIARLGKDALKTDMARDAAAGAAVGAVVAIPVPLIGPVAGAVIGAGLGVYKNITRGSSKSPDPVILPMPHEFPDAVSIPKLEKLDMDKYEELNKLHDLKTKGVLTDEEFAVEKKKILDR